MSGGEIMGVVLFILAIIGSVAGFWWRVESKVKEVEDRAEKISESLAAHKLHVAENYLTKAGLREAVEPIMDAIQGVKGAVDHLGGRIDAIYAQQQHSAPTHT